MSKHAEIAAIEYYLPTRVLTNEEVASQYPGWTAEKIESKTGICERRLASEGECSSDMGVAAARKLFASGICRPDHIDFLVTCTETPDYLLPANACIVQHRLGIPTSAGAFDVPLGCSGYIYCLSLIKGLIETGQANNVLLLT